MRTKLLLTLLVLLCGAMPTMAQSSPIATLSHDGQMTAYYGATALSAAVEAAVDGDVITLSNGTFNACNITKAVTIRGAGMVPNPVTNQFPTYISGNITISSTSTTHRLIMEGLNCTGKLCYRYAVPNPLFQKCIFNGVQTESQSYFSMINATFVNCHVTGDFILTSACTQATLVNCFLTTLNANDCVIDAQNCVINCYNFALVKNSTFANCIFVKNGNNSPVHFKAGNNVYNCVYTGSSDNIFANIAFDGNNKVVPNVADVFQEFTGENYSYDVSFALTETAAATYLGTDGTQVGMYGGSLPFDPMMSVLQIKRCNVASKTTADGKLSIDIEVGGFE